MLIDGRIAFSVALLSALVWTLSTAYAAEKIVYYDDPETSSALGPELAGRTPVRARISDRETIVLERLRQAAFSPFAAVHVVQPDARQGLALRGFAASSGAAAVTFEQCAGTEPGDCGPAITAVGPLAGPFIDIAEIAPSAPAADCATGSGRASRDLSGPSPEDVRGAQVIWKTSGCLRMKTMPNGDPQELPRTTDAFGPQVAGRFAAWWQDGPGSPSRGAIFSIYDTRTAKVVGSTRPGQLPGRPLDADLAPDGSAVVTTEQVVLPKKEEGPSRVERVTFVAPDGNTRVLRRGLAGAGGAVRFSGGTAVVYDDRSRGGRFLLLKPDGSVRGAGRAVDPPDYPVQSRRFDWAQGRLTWLTSTSEGVRVLHLDVP